MRLPLRFFVVALAVLAVLPAGGTARADGYAAPVSITVDVDATVPGIQNYKIASPSTAFTAAVLVGSVANLQAFNFEVAYDQSLLSSPTIPTGSDLDRNPDANQTALTATGRTWSCSPPAPSGDSDPSASIGAVFLSCFSSGAPAGPTFPSSGTVVAEIDFTVIGSGAASLVLRNTNTFSGGGIETGSCNPVVVLAATCVSAYIDQNADGDGLPDAYESARACLSPAANNAAGDGGSDGATNVAEFTAASEPCTPDTDGDGCSDGAELQTGSLTELDGGRRNPVNPWDYFNPTGDKQNRVDDILSVVERYFKDKGNQAYSTGHDRSFIGPDAWDLGPPDGLIRVTDIVNQVKQFFHDCA